MIAATGLLALSYVIRNGLQFWFVAMQQKALTNQEMMEKLISLIPKRDMRAAEQACLEAGPSRLQQVVKESLAVPNPDLKEILEASKFERLEAEKSAFVLISWLERATASGVYFGLFGTLIGIVKAFEEFGFADGNLKPLFDAIAGALVATAAGVLIAGFAVVALHVAQDAIRKFSSESEELTEKLVQLLKSRA